MNLTRKFNIFAGLLLAGYLFVVAYLAIFQAYLPLRDPNVNEGDKASALGLTASVATEYLPDGSPFWWITTEGLSLQYKNYLNEVVVGNIKLAFSGNPCRYSNKLLISVNENLQKEIIVGGKKVKEMDLEVKIAPFEILEVSIESITGDICLLDNGDIREFVAKFEGWSFE